jgi:hypothetical protein
MRYWSLLESTGRVRENIVPIVNAEAAERPLFAFPDYLHDMITSSIQRGARLNAIRGIYLTYQDMERRYR